MEALRLDLVGPPPGHRLAGERLPGWERPSKWYLTGFLIPSETAREVPEQGADADEVDDLGTAPETAGLPEESSEEPKPGKRAFFPSSIGLSFLVSEDTRTIEVTARWGDYRREAAEEEAGGGEKQAGKTVWRRYPNERTLRLDISGSEDEAEIPDSGGLRAHAAAHPVGGSGPGGIPPDCHFLPEHPDEEESAGKKRRFRYRWPSDVRDEALARLVELNATRAGAEAEARAGRAEARTPRRRARRRC